MTLGNSATTVVIMGELVLRETPDVPIWSVDAQESGIGAV